MDGPKNLMVIESLMFLDGPVERERLEEVVRTRLLDIYPVFSRRPVPSRRRWGRARWRDVGEVDLSRHIREVRLPAPGDDATLQAYVGRFLATPLPRDRPLWDIHLIEGLAEGAAIYVRLHHALADGIALTQVLFSLTDLSPDGDRDGSFRPDGRHHLLSEVVEAARRVAPEVPQLLRPARMRAGFRTGVRVGLSGMGVLKKLVFTTNPESAVAGLAGSEKRAVWSTPMPLQRIKDIAAHSGATVNDVLVSALAGALARYQSDHGRPAVDLPTMIPVNLRPLHVPLPRELGNRFALVLLIMPSGVGAPAARLAETKRRMDAIKASPEVAITFGLIQAIGMLGNRLNRSLVTFFAGKVTGVTTNVPGPREARYLAGTRISGLLGWVPGSGGQTLGTCIFTYAGTVRIGFKTDTAVIPDPEKLLVAFQAEIEALESTVAVAAT